MRDIIKTRIWLTQPQDIAKLSDPEFMPSYNEAPYDMAGEGWLWGHEVTIEVERPTAKELMPDAVAVLKAQRDAINLRAAEAIAEVNAKLQTLLAIAHDAGT